MKILMRCERGDACVKLLMIVVVGWTEEAAVAGELRKLVRWVSLTLSKVFVSFYKPYFSFVKLLTWWQRWDGGTKLQVKREEER